MGREIEKIFAKAKAMAAGRHLSWRCRSPPHRRRGNQAPDHPLQSARGRLSYGLVIMAHHPAHSVLGIVPARRGSEGIPRKNTRLLGGKPFLAYTTAAREEGLDLPPRNRKTHPSSLQENRATHPRVVA
jgi:Cytidylyltransferase